MISYEVEVESTHAHCRSQVPDLTDDVYIWFGCSAENIWNKCGMWVLQLLDREVTCARILEMLVWVNEAENKTMQVVFKED